MKIYMDMGATGRDGLFYILFSLGGCDWSFRRKERSKLWLHPNHLVHKAQRFCFIVRPRALASSSTPVHHHPCIDSYTTPLSHILTTTTTLPSSTHSRLLLPPRLPSPVPRRPLRAALPPSTTAAAAALGPFGAAGGGSGLAGVVRGLHLGHVRLCVFVFVYICVGEWSTARQTVSEHPYRFYAIYVIYLGGLGVVHDGERVVPPDDAARLLLHRLGCLLFDWFVGWSVVG